MPYNGGTPQSFASTDKFTCKSIVIDGAVNTWYLGRRPYLSTTDYAINAIALKTSNGLYTNDYKFMEITGGFTNGAVAGGALLGSYGT